MKTTTLCYLVKDKQVLLAMKKRGFGMGKWNGVGGKISEGETVEQAAIREIKEEIGVIVMPENLKKAGFLNFIYKDNPAWDHESHLFLVEKWQGEPAESEEMRPQWYPVDNLPFEAMWVDDRFWLPNVLAGNIIQGEFLFDKTGETIIDSKLTS